MMSLPDKNNFAVTNQRCLKLRGYAQGGFFSANFAQIGPPQAHLPLSAELIGAHSDFIKFHLTFELYMVPKSSSQGSFSFSLRWLQCHHQRT